jgi:hypothetical protein
MGRSTLAFARHYAVMVLVMFAGMGAFVGALALGAAAFDSTYGDVRADAPGVILFGMGFGMTAAMVWWMVSRGHSSQANRAMALAMILPTLLTLGLLAFGAVEDVGTLLTIEHVVMFPAMLVAMLPYRAEFTGTHAHA